MSFFYLDYFTIFLYLAAWLRNVIVILNRLEGHVKELRQRAPLTAEDDTEVLDLPKTPEDIVTFFTDVGKDVLKRKQLVSRMLFTIYLPNLI